MSLFNKTDDSAEELPEEVAPFTLIESLDMQVEALALLHSGALNLDCSKCSTSFMEDSHCLFLNSEDYNDEPTIYEPVNDREYCNCPISLISKYVTDLYDEWDFMETVGHNYDKDNMPAVLWWFIKRYRHYKNTFEIRVNEIESDKARRGPK